MKYLALAVDSTGLEPDARITGLRGVQWDSDTGERSKTFHALVNPGIDIPEKIVRMTKITNDMVRKAKPIEEALPRLAARLEGHVLVSFNTWGFQGPIINREAERVGSDFRVNLGRSIDLLLWSRWLYPKVENRTLRGFCNRYGLDSNQDNRPDNYLALLQRWMPHPPWEAGETIFDWQDNIITKLDTELEIMGEFGYIDRDNWNPMDDPKSLIVDFKNRSLRTVMEQAAAKGLTRLYNVLRDTYSGRG